MNDSHLYSVYGLRLRSASPLPLLLAGEGEVDVTLTDDGFLPHDLSSPLPTVVETRWKSDDTGSTLRYRNASGELLEYRFSPDGRWIRVGRTRLDIDDSCITLGPALGAALCLRGIPVLHGNGVTIMGRAIVIAGSSGVGKSTLCAALIVRGMSLLVDDLLPLSWRGDEILAQPGFPHMKLYRESCAVVGMPGDDWPRVVDHDAGDDKRWLDARELPGRFCGEATPLAAVYLLEGRSGELDVPRIDTLTPRQACVALLRHFYGTSLFGIDLETRLTWAGRIAGLIPVRRVVMPEDLEAVPVAARMIIGEVAR